MLHVALEKTTEKVAEMKMDDEKTVKVVEKPKVTVPLVGGVGAGEDDSDSDSEPAEDIEEYELDEGDDPVRALLLIIVCTL